MTNNAINSIIQKQYKQRQYLKISTLWLSFIIIKSMYYTSVINKIEKIIFNNKAVSFDISLDFIKNKELEKEIDRATDTDVINALKAFMKKKTSNKTKFILQEKMTIFDHSTITLEDVKRIKGIGNTKAPLVLNVLKSNSNKNNNIRKRLLNIKGIGPKILKEIENTIEL